MSSRDRFVGQIATAPIEDLIYGCVPCDGKELYTEMLKTPASRAAWSEARSKCPTPRRYKGVLEEYESRLISAYTCGGMDYSYQFYRELNEDFRKYGISGGTFPVAKKVLRNALIRLGRYQKENGLFVLPKKLYRYTQRVPMAKRGTLNMFTSTTLIPPTYVWTNEPIITICITFQGPQTGAYIREFSRYPDEKEVLLPPLYGIVEVLSESQASRTVKGPSDPLQELISGVAKAITRVLPAVINNCNQQ